MSKDYSKTLNLPKTDFPMKANLPKLEPEVQAFWANINLYQLVQEHNRDKPKYILHDGPPYTSGDIHLGQALNKILKDVIVKYKSMAGFNTPYIPGWDCHGLPTELKAIETFDINRKEIDILELRRKCFEFAARIVDVQRGQFKRLGVRGDWEHPYLTLDAVYEAKILEVFRELVRAGCIYRGMKPVYWCPKCETALAEAEIEYKEKVSPSIYVKFPLIDEPAFISDKLAGRNVYFIIWTTTPWTLPANTAIALHPRLKYYALSMGESEGVLIGTAYFVDELKKLFGAPINILDEFVGGKLEGLKCQHPFIKRQSLVVLADYVKEDEGTGCVHTAPGHGKEDYDTALKYNLPVVMPIDDRGYFTEDAAQFAGMYHEDGNEAIMAELAVGRYLLYRGEVIHQYPYCWRCHTPIIFRATKQWFMGLDEFTQMALKAIDGVKWVPNWGKERITNMVVERPDWCISRQRRWGVPIPAVYCKGCDEAILEPEVMDKLIDCILDEGRNVQAEGRDPSDVWYEGEVTEFLPAGFGCPKCGGKEFAKEKDTLDVWFDASSSHRAVMEGRAELGFPADLYLEAHDQYRGWYQGSLWTGIVTRGQSPYKAVLTHGWVLDETGKKMAKHLGNIIDPQVVANNYGADLLRLWVTYVDFKNDMPMSEDIFEQVTEAYRKIRNTLRFILGNLYDFEPVEDRVEYNDLPELDRWALLRLGKLVQRLTVAYEDFEFHLFYHLLNSFCVNDLSAFYFDAIKDRLYISPAKSLGRCAAQTVLYEIAVNLTKLMAPILTHTAEDIWQRLREKGEPEVSVQLASWPKAEAVWMDKELESRWVNILKVREEVYKALEVAKNSDVISKPLDAFVKLYVSEEINSPLAPLAGELKYILIVSDAGVAPLDLAPDNCWVSGTLKGLKVLVEQAAGKKCVRCWLYSESVGEDFEHPAICRRCADIVKSL